MRQNYVLTKLISTTRSFDLWMFKGAHAIYNFVGFYWQPKQVTIGLFEAIETINQALVNKLIKLFDQYGLKKKSLHMWVKFEYCDNYLEIYYEVRSLRFG